MGKFIPQKEALHGYPPRSALCMSMDAIHYTGWQTFVYCCRILLRMIPSFGHIHRNLLLCPHHFHFLDIYNFSLNKCPWFFLILDICIKSHNFAPINIYLQDIFNQLFCICPIFLFFVDITLLFFTYVHLLHFCWIIIMNEIKYIA